MPPPEGYATEDAYIDQVKKWVDGLKYKYERQEALEKLDKAEMTFDRLLVTRAPEKIINVFRSSRFEATARGLYNKWLQIADAELQERWDEIKGQFMSRDQIRTLQRSQTRYNRFHGYADDAPPTIEAVTPSARVMGGRDAYQPPTPSDPSSLADETVANADSNFVAYNYSTPSRGRGRPRGPYNVRGGVKKRGRPSIRR